MNQAIQQFNITFYKVSITFYKFNSLASNRTKEYMIFDAISNLTIHHHSSTLKLEIITHCGLKSPCIWKDLSLKVRTY